MKQLPLRTPFAANFFLLGRPCETDFFEYETAIFCGIVETDFKTDWRGDRNRLLQGAKTFGYHKNF